MCYCCCYCCCCCCCRYVVAVGHWIVTLLAAVPRLSLSLSHTVRVHTCSSKAVSPSCGMNRSSINQEVQHTTKTITRCCQISVPQSSTPAPQLTLLLPIIIAQTTNNNKQQHQQQKTTTTTTSPQLKNIHKHSDADKSEGLMGVQDYCQQFASGHGNKSDNTKSNTTITMTTI